MMLALATKPCCPLCNGTRVTEYAGDLQANDGYMELHTCPLCHDGRRIGRSDRLIVARPGEQRVGPRGIEL